MHIEVYSVDGIELDIETLRDKKISYKDSYFILNDGSVASLDDKAIKGTGKYICGAEIFLVRSVQVFYSLLKFQ